MADSARAAPGMDDRARLRIRNRWNGENAHVTLSDYTHLPHGGRQLGDADRVGAGFMRGDASRPRDHPRASSTGPNQDQTKGQRRHISPDPARRPQTPKPPSPPLTRPSATSLDETRLHGMQKVRGSNPLSSTIFRVFVR